MTINKALVLRMVAPYALNKTAQHKLASRKDIQQILATGEFPKTPEGVDRLVCPVTSSHDVHLARFAYRQAMQQFLAVHGIVVASESTYSLYESLANFIQQPPV